MKTNVLITGGTGFIGKCLTNLLVSNGYSVLILSRKVQQNTSAVTYYKWDIDKGLIDENAVLHADYIIHLAGEGIADKLWTKSRKMAILDSREKSANLIYDVLATHNKRLKAFISASGVGIYGAVNGERICTEEMPAADDFLGTTCKIWEDSVDRFAFLGIRVVKLRTGLVFGKNGGFLLRLIPLFKYRLASVLGSGTQYMPWIYIDDLCFMYLKAINDEAMCGAYNATITDNTTNKSFTHLWAKIYGYSIWLPKIPAFFLRLVLGEMSLILLTGQRIASDKIKATGFQFQCTNLEQALRNSLNLRIK